jgi:hypothetical protein
MFLELSHFFREQQAAKTEIRNAVRARNLQGKKRAIEKLVAAKKQQKALERQREKGKAISGQVERLFLEYQF